MNGALTAYAECAAHPVPLRAQILGLQQAVRPQRRVRRSRALGHADGAVVLLEVLHAPAEGAMLSEEDLRREDRMRAPALNTTKTPLNALIRSSSRYPTTWTVLLNHLWDDFIAHRTLSCSSIQQVQTVPNNGGAKKQHGAEHPNCPTPQKRTAGETTP